ncbi:MAG: hypothetical protein K2W82_09725 [Candidatus Obscuribacterales bacterium]|nr:hypothetical protein [Candidatus Obscuribacterales bacterium]
MIPKGLIFMMNTFDLIEYQEQARNASSPRKLFELWEDICRRYDRGEIGKYELDEMKEAIWPMMRLLTRLQMEIDGHPISGESKAYVHSISGNLEKRKAS